MTGSMHSSGSTSRGRCLRDSRQPNLGHTEPDGDSSEPGDLVVGEDVGSAQIFMIVINLAGHAIDAPETATVGDRDPKIPHGALERIKGHIRKLALSEDPRSRISDCRPKLRPGRPTQQSLARRISLRSGIRDLLMHQRQEF
jgi:hypothetical protein